MRQKKRAFALQLGRIAERAHAFAHPASNNRHHSFTKENVMKTRLLVFIAAMLAGAFALAEQGGKESPNPKVASYIAGAIGEFDRIPAERRKLLEKVALYVQSRIAAGQEAKLTFICTHNSRRSQLAQVRAQTAACYYAVPSIKTYSGGIQATACNPRTVAAMERAGFEIRKTSGASAFFRAYQRAAMERTGFEIRKTGEDKNPVYEVTYARSQEPIKAFSKVYSDPPNPSGDFCAVMCCDHADKNCPTVKGCSLRVLVLYKNPKEFDGTPQEAAAYDERCRQICREMFYLVSKVQPTKAAE